MYRRSVWIAPTLIVALLACGCGSKETPMSGQSRQTSSDKQEEAIAEAPRPTGQVAFHVTYVSRSRGVAKPAAVDSMTAYVYEPAGQKIAEQSLDHVGSRWKALITVPAGHDRRVDLPAYDGDVVAWLGADMDVDVIAGDTTTADIAMKEFVPHIAEFDSPDAERSHTVRWSGVEDATGYTLEESTDETFSSPMSFVVSDTVKVMMHAEDGTYWYRVKATCRYGDGKWCTAQSIVVRIGGTIEIDIPGPPPQTATFALPGGATIEMVWIEPGTFMMGSPDWDYMADDAEKPQHEVTITQEFYLGKYEITQGQWQSVMGTTPWSGQGFGVDPVGGYVQEDSNNPAVYISWDDMQAFIAKLNATEGSEVYRLPTEAEWEYACRAGTTTWWSFGDDESQLGEYAWYYDNARKVGEDYAHTVGTKLPNPWGLYDVHGNVYEWCQDWSSESYSSDPQTDPTGGAPGLYRILRGGGFYETTFLVRSAKRAWALPGGYRVSYFGARLLRQEP